ncbi:hypothetical protein ACQR3P_01735 [Rhodococcus sp. IEGM1300]
MSNIDWSKLITKEAKDADRAAQVLDQMVAGELSWRVVELAAIARQLEAIEEDEADETPSDLLPGTRKLWLKYRGLVSNWKEGAESFPDIAHRPVRPS